MNREALAQRLRAAFLEDLEEQLRTIETELLKLEESPGDASALKALFRAFHTLKGGAQAAGVAEIESATHALESLLSDVREGIKSLTAGQFRLLFAAADALREAGTLVRDGATLDGSALQRLGSALEKGELHEAEAEEPIGATEVDADANVRVQAEKLDALASSVGQLLMIRAGSVARAQGLESLHEEWSAWTRQSNRAMRELGAAIEHLGGAPALVHRLEALEDRLKELLRKNAQLTSHSAADARTLGQTADQLASRVRRVRLRPFKEVAESLPRTVRDIALQLGKEVKVVIGGGAVEADRAVLVGVREALLHIVRNAIDHGIEAPDAREKAGKPRVGTLHVGAALRGQSLTVTVRDDGRGLDVAALRAARERQGSTPVTDERELVAALLSGGLSSRSEVTSVSGRGVGLDAARAAMQRIRGTIEVSWTEGQGTQFTLVSPLTLMTIRALLVRVSGQSFAIPTSAAVRLIRVRPDAIRRVQNRDVVEDVDAPVPITSLATLLGPPLVATAPKGRIPTLMLAAGGRRLALAVDELRIEQELVVRPLERTRSALLAGAAILGSGEVALVLDASALVDAGWKSTSSGIGTVAETAEVRRRRILVVDDSITTRTLEQSTLEAAGYSVMTAVDGADAWRLLQEHTFDAVVSDVEMPKMDGFALCEAVRASTRFKDLPIVLVTGLETDEHRARGMEVGADAYIGKSSFDQQHLLDTIAQLVGA
jgi:two-component system chemotaxis sensor kinase CheA